MRKNTRWVWVLLPVSLACLLFFSLLSRNGGPITATRSVETVLVREQVQSHSKLSPQELYQRVHNNAQLEPSPPHPPNFETVQEFAKSVKLSVSDLEQVLETSPEDADRLQNRADRHHRVLLEVYENEQQRPPSRATAAIVPEGIMICNNEHVPLIALSGTIECSAITGKVVSGPYPGTSRIAGGNLIPETKLSFNQNNLWIEGQSCIMMPNEINLVPALATCAAQHWLPEHHEFLAW
jgi:hypothetical protein